MKMIANKDIRTYSQLEAAIQSHKIRRQIIAEEFKTSVANNPALKLSLKLLPKIGAMLLFRRNSSILGALAKTAVSTWLVGKVKNLLSRREQV